MHRSTIIFLVSMILILITVETVQGQAKCTQEELDDGCHFDFILGKCVCTPYEKNKLPIELRRRRFNSALLKHK